MRWGGDEGPLQVGRKDYPTELLIARPDTTEMIASVKVHESLASRLKPGLAASVKIDAASEKRFTGKVETIGILAEQTSRWMDPNLREYTVKIALDAVAVAAASTDKVHGLKPSMRLRSLEHLPGGRSRTRSPSPSRPWHVFSDGLVRYVYLPDGSRFTRRPVQIGQRSERFAEVKVGLQPGQHVLLRKPEAAEVLARPWDAAELAAVGLQLNDQGTVVPTPLPTEHGRRQGRNGSCRCPDTPSPHRPFPHWAPVSKEAAAPPAEADKATPAVSTPAPTPASVPDASAPRAVVGLVALAPLTRSCLRRRASAPGCAPIHPQAPCCTSAAGRTPTDWLARRNPWTRRARRSARSAGHDARPDRSAPRAGLPLRARPARRPLPKPPSCSDLGSTLTGGMHGRVGSHPVTTHLRPSLSVTMLPGGNAGTTARSDLNTI